MSNLLKRVYTVNKDERVIDYNDLIKKKLEAIMESKHAAVDMKAVLRQMRKLKRSSRSLRRSTIRKNQNLKMNITS